MTSCYRAAQSGQAAVMHALRKATVLNSTSALACRGKRRIVDVAGTLSLAIEPFEQT